MNILLIGIDYYPYLSPSDKKFWFLLSSHFAIAGNKLIIISFNNNWQNKIDYQKVGEKAIPIYNYSLVPFLNPYTFIQGSISRFINIIKIKKEINEIAINNDINVIHFMDNFSLGIRAFNKSTFKGLISASIPTFPQNSLVYDFFLRISYKYVDAIIVFSESLKKRLININFTQEKLRLIRWGTDIPSKAQEEMKYQKKAKYLDNIDKKLILWAGFLSQVKEEDFYYSIKIAKNILANTNLCEFIFAFKMHSFKSKYKKYERRGIKILWTEPDEFKDLLIAADIFICPILRSRSIIAPPLTWIEAMSLGKPVITTRVEGAEEIIINGRTGYICYSINEFVKLLLKLITDDVLLKKMSKESILLITERFNVRKSARQYLDFWRDLINGNIPC